MKTLLSLVVSLVVGFGVLAIAQSAMAAEKPLQAGDPAPEFKMQGTDGKTYSLEDFKGQQAVVIAWYPRAFTGGCTKECKSLKEDGPKLRLYDAAYFTASCDSVEKNKAFAESLELDYPILSDPTGENAKKFGVLRASKTPTASRVTFYIGKDGKILHVDDEVQTASHGADIAERLGKLGVEKK